MEQLIETNQDKLQKRFNEEINDNNVYYSDDISKAKKKYKRMMRRLEQNYQNKINELEASYQNKMDKLVDLCNEFKEQIKKRITDTYDELKTKYEEYLQDNNKNIISIKGEYYDRINEGYYDTTNEEYFNITLAKHIERTLDNWILYNSYEMDTINLFLKELPISYSLSLSPYKVHNEYEFNSLLGYKYDGGENLIITLTKLD